MSNKKQISSGAEKAEKLADDTTETKKSATKKNTAHSSSTKNKGGASKNVKAQTGKTKGNSADKKREKKEQLAILKAQKKERKIEKRLEHKQKIAERKALLKEKKAERAAERQKRRDLLKSESKEARRDRIASERQAKREAKAAKRQEKAAKAQAKREHALKVKAERRAARNDKRHAPGFGGWLAAVISLGVTTLALGTVLTFGWLNMNGMQATMSNEQTETLYELNSVVDNLDTNLAKARVASSSGDRAKILTDIAIESEMAEVMLERLPVDITMTEQMASFINKMSDSAQSMIYTIAEGGDLSSSQLASLQYMYETNLQLKRALNQITANYNSADIMAALRGKGSVLGESFTDIQNNVIQSPKGIQDGPFSDSVKTGSAKALTGLKEITAPEAEKLAKEYFADYSPISITCTGEAVANSLGCYNLKIQTADGEMMAQLSKNGGKVVMFDSYKECTAHNFSVERCVTIAEDFLDSIGYGNLKAVWTSENGTTCNLNFAPVDCGAVIYPDLIKVKVCEERGLVTGIEAISYCLNHTQRQIAKASITEKQAQSAINGDIEVSLSRLALIPLNGQEILTYEFFGANGDNEYYVYVDAQTGEEVEVLTIIGTAQGKALM
jgi:germination protein YpeB